MHVLTRPEGIRREKNAVQHYCHKGSWKLRKLTSELLKKKITAEPIYSKIILVYTVSVRLDIQNGRS
jgi:hypothetical protein